MPYDRGLELTYEIFTNFVDKKNLYPWWREKIWMAMHDNNEPKHRLVWDTHSVDIHMGYSMNS